MTYKRTIVIGDLHGCFAELQDLLEKLHYSPSTDELIFTGDVINRGPQSVECIKFIGQQKAISVLGNHEYFLLKSVQIGRTDTNVYSNMLREFRSGFSDLVQTIKHWPLWVEREDFLVIHAGLHPEIDKNSTPPEYLVNVRKVVTTNRCYVPWFHFYKSDKLVLFGHWAKLMGVEQDKVVGLDMGCVYGNKLRAIVLPEKRIVEVAARATYFRA